MKNGKLISPARLTEDEETMVLGVLAYEALRSRIRRVGVIGRIAGLMVALFITGLSPTFHVQRIEELPFVNLVIAFVVFTSFWMLFNPNRYLYKTEYYSLPGSTTSLGNHRCLFCGGSGIYRHGKYKSNRLFSDCSQCEHPLFSQYRFFR